MTHAITDIHLKRRFVSGLRMLFLSLVRSSYWLHVLSSVLVWTFSSVCFSLAFGIMGFALIGSSAVEPLLASASPDNVDILDNFLLRVSNLKFLNFRGSKYISFIKKLWSDSISGKMNPLKFASRPTCGFVALLVIAPFENMGDLGLKIFLGLLLRNCSPSVRITALFKPKICWYKTQDRRGYMRGEIGKETN